MMIKDIESSENLVVDIGFKDGSGVTNCDLPTNPFGIQGMFSFWSKDNKLSIVNLKDIHIIQMYEKGVNDERHI